MALGFSKAILKATANGALASKFSGKSTSNLKNTLPKLSRKWETKMKTFSVHHTRSPELYLPYTHTPRSYQRMFQQMSK